MNYKMSSVVLVLLVTVAFIVANAADQQTSAGEDITVRFAEPIDLANKLLYDLDQQLQLIVKSQTPSETVTGTPLLEKTRNEIMSKNAATADGNGLDGIDENNIGVLLNNLGDLDRKLQGTFQDLQVRRRYVLGAMIRQMQSTVRRIRSNVSRMQSQLNSIESVATQMPLLRPSIQSANSTAAIATANAITANKELIDQIEQRIHSVSKRINEIVTRLNSSLNVPSSANADNSSHKPIIILNSVIQTHGSRGRPKNPSV